VLIFALILLFRTSLLAGEFLREYPHLMKVFSPIGFLMFPLFYLAIKYAINEGQYFKKTDVIHFIPAFIHFLELIPLYMLSKSEKLVLLEELFFDMYAIVIFVHGLIPGIWIELFRLVLMIFYFIIVVALVFNFKIETFKKFIKGKSNSIFIGTIFYILLIMVTLIGLFFLNFISFFEVLHLFINKNIFILILLVLVISYNIYVFRNVTLYLGLNNVKNPLIFEKKTQLPTDTSDFKPSLDWKDLDLNKSEVESRLIQLLEVSQIFLIAELTTSDFAKEADLPSRLLPKILNLTFKKSFKELINEYRIKFAKKKIDEGYLLLYTVDSLASECGFNSRFTFSNVFKSELGLSPNKYSGVVRKKIKTLG